jgi:hypothetical protein
MDLKLLKFHTIVHIWEVILELGVPLEYDTSANKSMHKPSKNASKMTQKAHAMFNFQTANRLVEFYLIDLAMEELQSQKQLWEFYDRRTPKKQQNPPEPPVWTGETKIIVSRDPESGEPSFDMRTKSKFADKTVWNTKLLLFRLELQDKVEQYLQSEDMPIFICHKQNGQVFSGHPNYRGKGPWKDWVWVDWGAGYGRLPAHIWCFVVLRGMPTGRNTIHYGGIPLTDGAFAVVVDSILGRKRSFRNQI